MSCHLVGEDFTAEYFLNLTSDNESDSDQSETYIDDSLDSDTDVESVSSDGNGQAPFQWQSMVRTLCCSLTIGKSCQVRDWTHLLPIKEPRKSMKRHC